MQLLPVLPPETVRDYLVVVLAIAFIIRISMIIGPLRRLATSIDDYMEKFKAAYEDSCGEEASFVHKYHTQANLPEMLRSRHKL